MARDLLAALWPASFKGLPFYVERDSEKGGRRLAINEFYGRDDPFIEDLGAAARHYELTVYLVGDSYDTLADGLVSTFVLAGAGTLVLPMQGPVQARLQTFDLDRTLDRTGYVAFRAHFVREGVATALASVAYLAQLAYDGVATVAALAGSIATALDVSAAPAWVVGSAVAAVQDVVATLDAIRGESAIDAATSASMAVSLTSLYQSVPSRLDPVSGVDPTLVPALVSAAVTLADAMTPGDAVTAFASAFDAVADPAALVPGRSGNVVTASANAEVLAGAARLVMLAAYVEALIGATYASRPEGISARADCVERFDIALAASGGGTTIAILVALQDLRGTIVDYLSALIADLAPIVTVTTNVSTPSIVMAWRLYQDPSRAADLVARNGVKHPSFMPLSFEALAPSSSVSLAR